jgi:threonine synthase
VSQPTLVCEWCRREYPAGSPLTECPCGSLMSVRIAIPRARGQALRRLFEGRAGAEAPGQGSGVWRYRELLLPGRGATVSHPEGNTALYRRDGVAAYAGVDDLRLKHEGENPTGSFKDRGMTVAVTQAVRTGATAVACASTGNTSASMAAYAANAGLPAFVFVPAGKIAAGKLAQALAYGARTLLVKGDFDACLQLARESSQQLGIRLLNSVNPWRIEGQKTIVLELLQQLGWQPPDWIVVPAGNLGNTSAFGKALQEARQLGLIRKLPRIAAIQAAGASPFHKSFRVGFERRFKVKAETIATAIRIGNPASFERGVLAIRATRGVVAAVSDREILAAKAVVDAAGIGCEPASAATVAGIRQLVRRGLVKRTASVVAVLTGNVLKDPQAVIDFHMARRATAAANRPIEVRGRVAEVERLLGRR